MCSFAVGFATLTPRWSLVEEDMDIRLTATPKGNGFQATIIFSDGVSISSAEAFPSKAEAILAAAEKLLRMPDRVQRAADEETTLGMD